MPHATTRTVTLPSVLTCLSVLLLSSSAFAGEVVGGHSTELAWYTWCVILFFFTLAIGVVAPISGVGGGALFVPFATAFFPFNLDFIRGTGLIVALVSAQSSAPALVKKKLANIRVMIPIVAVSMCTSVLGSLAGLHLTNAYPNGQHYIVLSLGVLLFLIFLIMLFSKRVEHPEVGQQDDISARLGLCGSWLENNHDSPTSYKLTNFLLGLVCFAFVGFIAGMFGLGAGWASVPVLNLVIGAPIKIATSTSMAIITVNGAAASCTYISKGAILPLILLPSVLGVSIGARIGSHLASVAKPTAIKYLVMGIMLLAGSTNIWKGLKGLEVFAG